MNFFFDLQIVRGKTIYNALTRAAIYFEFSERSENCAMPPLDYEIANSMYLYARKISYSNIRITKSKILNCNRLWDRKCDERSSVVHLMTYANNN